MIYIYMLGRLGTAVTAGSPFAFPAYRGSNYASKLLASTSLMTSATPNLGAEVTCHGKQSPEFREISIMTHNDSTMIRHSM